MRYFIRDGSWELIELKPQPVTATLYKHTWKETDGFEWASFHLERQPDGDPKLLTVEEIEGVVLERVE